MWKFLLLSSCIVSAAWSGEAASQQLLSFRMDETPDALTTAFRHQPSIVAQPDYRVLSFHGAAAAAPEPDAEFEWEFFYSEDGALQSVTWNCDKPVRAEELFPAADRRVVSAGVSKTKVLLRELPGNRILLAYVNTATENEIRQVVLLRASAVDRFFPWLAAQQRQSRTHGNAKLPAALAVKGLTDRH